MIDNGIKRKGVCWYTWVPRWKCFNCFEMSMKLTRPRVVGSVVRFGAKTLGTWPSRCQVWFVSRHSCGHLAIPMMCYRSKGKKNTPSWMFRYLFVGTCHDDQNFFESASCWLRNQRNHPWTSSAQKSCWRNCRMIGPLTLRLDGEQRLNGQFSVWSQSHFWLWVDSVHKQSSRAVSGLFQIDENMNSFVV